MIEQKLSKTMEEYFKTFDVEIKKCYDVANDARIKGLDPENKIDIPLALDMAERVEGLISAVMPQILKSGVAERIRELEREYGILDWRVGLIVAIEVAKQKFCKFENVKEAMETGIRVGLSYITLGIISAPLEGFIDITLKKTRGGEEYMAINYAGPIRASGGTAEAVSVIIADYVRMKMGYAKYDPDENEVKRFCTELDDYHERCANLQYRPSMEETVFLVKHIPVEISGDPTEEKEVSNYKDLPRIKVNRVRGGMCLVLAEGIAQKAPKVYAKLSKWGEEFGLKDWLWMNDFLELQKNMKAKLKLSELDKKEDGKEKPQIMPNFTFIKDLVAGRPILTYPLAQGGFRLRYGRARTSGFAAYSIHPATMVVLDNFIATGTQLKVERPGKATVVSPCDTIEGPIVRLTNGNVLRLDKEEEAISLKKEVDEILYLGDILIAYGDFVENGHKLVPAGYCEEWYSQELEKAIINAFGSLDLAKLVDLTGIDFYLIESLLKDPLRTKIFAEDVLKLSKELKIPLHPSYTFHWNAITLQEYNYLINFIEKISVVKEEGIIKKIIFPYIKKIKRIFELLGIPHILVNKEFVVLNKDNSLIFLSNLNYKEEFDVNSIIKIIQDNQDKKVLDIVNLVSEYKVRDKSGTFIGCRMGRPEKAKMRKLPGSPHLLFPVGEEGGRMKSFQSAMEKGKIGSNFPAYKCEYCNKNLIFPICSVCGAKTKQLFFCRFCKKAIESSECILKSSEGVLHGRAQRFSTQTIDIKTLFEEARKKLEMKTFPDLIKGIKETINKDHIPESLVKGLLRSKYEIYVNKDGTTRYDMIQMPITHFRAKEVRSSVDRLRELGYYEDIYHEPLVSAEQLIELKPQDIILPCCPESMEEGADEVLLRVSKFIDELLQKHYGLPHYYNLKSKEDLVGHFLINLAPHTSAGIVSRIIGFSKTQGMYCHPMAHAATRRNCVYPATKFIYSKKDVLNVTEIGKYVEELIQNNYSISKMDEFGTVKVECPNDLFAFGVDPFTKKLKKKKIKYFIKGKSPKQWVKITTTTNREQIMTPNHDFMYVNHNNFEFKKAKEIKVGDKLGILNKFENNNKSNLKLNLIKLLIENVPDKNLKNIFLINQVDVKRKRNTLYHIKNLKLDSDELAKNNLLKIRYSKRLFNPYLWFDENIASLLGYYSAEGHCRQSASVSQVSFRIQDKEIQNKIQELIKTVFKIKPNLGEDSTKITICDQMIYLLFKFVFQAGSNAYNKKVPGLILNAPDSLVTHYISAFIDGDGSVIPQNNSVVLYSVNRSLLDDISFLLLRFNVFSKYHTTKPRLPGKTVLEKYVKLGKQPKTHILHHLIINGRDITKLKSTLKLVSKSKSLKLSILKNNEDLRKTRFGKKYYEIKEENDVIFDYVKKVELIRDNSSSYCLEIDWSTKEDRNILWGEQILNARCDGDEAGVMLLLDGLLNFSRQFLPDRRGGRTMDACLVLTAHLVPSEVDTEVHNLDIVWKYPLELYEAALKYEEAWKIKIKKIGDTLGTDAQYEGMGFTHDTDNLNAGVRCSAYKTLPSMQDKLVGQMELARKIRAVNSTDVATLVIEKHFIRDIMGNLRKFSQQSFRCVGCNHIYRRPPLVGKCTECGGKLIFTISQGSIIKYLEPSLELARKYGVNPYLSQCLELLKRRVEGVFGKEKEKQAGLGAWF